jgi:hypothetical protein
MEGVGARSKKRLWLACGGGGRREHQKGEEKGEMVGASCVLFVLELPTTQNLKNLTFWGLCPCDVRVSNRALASESDECRSFVTQNVHKKENLTIYLKLWY